jgi:DNA-binding GntR family transcriptional regulator
MLKVDTAKTKRKRGWSIDQVHQQIKSMIYNNELAPGQKLIYQDLAKRLNASTTPILQALNRLENMKLVRYEPNKGFFVGEITEEEAIELYQAREALEIYIIPKIAENLNRNKLNAIRQAFRNHKSSTVPNYRRTLILRDAEFHLSIAETAKNEVISSLLRILFERIYLKYRPEYLGDQRIEEVLKEHRNLLKALENKDIEKAIGLTKEHIKSGMEHVVSSLRVQKLRPFDR